MIKLSKAQQKIVDRIMDDEGMVFKYGNIDRWYLCGAQRIGEDRVNRVIVKQLIKLDVLKQDSSRPHVFHLNWSLIND